MPAFAKNRTPSTDTKKPSKAAFFKVQAKLKMGQSGDKYEQEADSVAQQVVKNNVKTVRKEVCQMERQNYLL